MVKANAYGHGAEEVVAALQGIVHGFAVALIDEALAVRVAACGKDILVFTPPLDEEEVQAIASNRFIATVPDFWTAKKIVATCQRQGLNVRVHLKVNTGMNRYGMSLSELGKVCKYLSDKNCVSVEGLYSHLYRCCVETATKQKALFDKAISIAKGYFPTLIAHLGGTYAAMLGKDFVYDAVRVGIGLYGYTPTGKKEIPLKKAMAVYATTITNRKVKRGGIGYGKEYYFEKPIRLSVCRFGYADGFLRKKKNGVVGEEKHLNRLCMDVCLRRDNKRRGERVLLLSDADETAKKTGTISYEVLCAATRRAEFVYEYE